MWENIGLLIAGVAIGMVVYKFVLAGKPATVQGVMQAGMEVMPLIKQIEQAVQIGVNAIEQNNREKEKSGVAYTYATPQEDSDFVINFVKRWVPQARGIANSEITDFLKSAVLVASTMTHTINAAKAKVAEVQVVVAEAAAVPNTPEIAAVLKATNVAESKEGNIDYKRPPDKPLILGR